MTKDTDGKQQRKENQNRCMCHFKKELADCHKDLESPGVQQNRASTYAQVDLISLESGPDLCALSAFPVPLYYVRVSTGQISYSVLKLLIL